MCVYVYMCKPGEEAFSVQINNEGKMLHYHERNVDDNEAIIFRPVGEIWSESVNNLLPVSNRVFFTVHRDDFLRSFFPVNSLWIQLIITYKRYLVNRTCRIIYCCESCDHRHAVISEIRLT